MQIFDRPQRPPRARLSERLGGAGRSLLAAARTLGGAGALQAARRPLVWLIAAECVVCLALVGTAWHLVSAAAAGAGAATAGPGLPSVSAPLAPADPPPPTVATAPASSVPQPARPGLGTGGAFLGGLLDGLNQDQAAFENSEWAALQALSGAIRVYIENVMLPAVERARRTPRRAPT